MPFLNYPDGTIVVVPYLFRAWVCIVRDQAGSGTLVSATNAKALEEEAAAFMRSLGPTDLDGGPIRMCPPDLAAKAVFPYANSRSS